MNASGKHTIVQCPTCSEEVTWDETSRWRPFCSERCRLIDLGAWADESHRIPGEELPTHQNPDSDLN